MPRITDVEQRREQILRAAVKVFSNRGYAEATISDIANEAGVAHGTVYLYFRSKSGILQQLHSRFAQWLIDDVIGSGDGGARAGDFAAELLELFRVVLEVCYEHRQVTEVCLKELTSVESDVAPSMRAMEQVLTERLTTRCAEAIAAGTVRALRPEFVGDLIFRLLGVTIRRLLALGSAADVEQMAHEAVDFIMFGLAPEGARNNLTAAIVPTVQSEKRTTPPSSDGLQEETR